ncbi:MAG: hypothetical protein LBT30_04465 [Clostridiales bacterium]|jgi:CarD family transcriptional regulator|nr:hypothetical protein [Clostridiales bacterium]
MYNKGDYLILKNGGIWHVDSVEDDDVSLTEHGGGSVILLPQKSKDIVRTVVSKEAITEVIDRIPFICTIQAPKDSVRKELYDTAMEAYDEIEWVRIIKTIYLRCQEGRLMESELAYGKRAKGFLYGEISVLLDIPADKAEEYIKQNIDGSW